MNIDDLVREAQGMDKDALAAKLKEIRSGRRIVEEPRQRRVIEGIPTTKAPGTPRAPRAKAAEMPKVEWSQEDLDLMGGLDL